MEGAPSETLLYMTVGFQSSKNLIEITNTP